MDRNEAVKKIRELKLIDLPGVALAASELHMFSNEDAEEESEVTLYELHIVVPNGTTFAYGAVAEVGVEPVDYMMSKSDCVLLICRAMGYTDEDIVLVSSEIAETTRILNADDWEALKNKFSDWKCLRLMKAQKTVKTNNVNKMLAQHVQTLFNRIDAGLLEAARMQP